MVSYWQSIRWNKLGGWPSFPLNSFSSLKWGASVDFQLKFYSSCFITLDRLALHKQTPPFQIWAAFFPFISNFDCCLVDLLKITFKNPHNYICICHNLLCALLVQWITLFQRSNQVFKQHMYICDIWLAKIRELYFLTFIWKWVLRMKMKISL